MLLIIFSKFMKKSPKNIPPKIAVFVLWVGGGDFLAQGEIFSLKLFSHRMRFFFKILFLKAIHFGKKTIDLSDPRKKKDAKIDLKRKQSQKLRGF